MAAGRWQHAPPPAAAAASQLAAMELHCAAPVALVVSAGSKQDSAQQLPAI
jgi:hypothetical protein